MVTERYDAVVVGGGPAGSAAAYTLAAAGKKVCLIDKSEFPRDKLCGGGLTFRSKRAFERVFKRQWNAALFNSSQDVSFFSMGRFLASYKIRARLYFTSRMSFDHYLLNLARDAGATLKLGDAVGEIDLERQTIALRSGREIGFGFLIGADGVSSLVAKALFGNSFDPATVAFALEAEVPRDRLPQQGDRVEIDFSAARWGYGWVFPKPESLTIGIGGLHRLNPELRRSLDEYFQRKGLDTKEFKVKGQYLPGGGYRVIPGRGNVLLCGDAAGAVDPLSGEGIPFALQTGGDAGRAVAAALSQPLGRGALELYCADYKDVVAALRRGKFWRWFVYPRLAQRCFAWAFGYEAVRKWMLVERRS
jgi:geranylgeranyl reductase family protein